MVQGLKSLKWFKDFLLLKNQRVHHRIHKIIQFNSIFNLFYPVQTLITFDIQCNIILSSASWSLKYSFP